MSSIEPTDQERRAFGDLADDIAFLRRGCHLIVAPFHGAFRIGEGAGLEVVEPAALRARAIRERERRQVVYTGKVTIDGQPVAIICPCGRPNSHQGRCWYRRGLAGPTEKSKSSGGQDGLAPKCEVARVTVGALPDACCSEGVRCAEESTVERSGHTVAARPREAGTALTAEGPRAGIKPGPLDTSRPPDQPRAPLRSDRHAARIEAIDGLRADLRDLTSSLNRLCDELARRS